MMNQLQPFFRVVPSLLFVFGIVITAANIAELRATSAPGSMTGAFYDNARIIYVVGLIRSFYDLFFLWGMAALVAAANRYLEQREEI